MHAPLQFGLDTFGDVTVDLDGALLPQHQVIRNIVEQAVLADQLGIDAFGVGEHHRDDFAVTSPDVVLAAAASRTSRILLGTAVTVLSSDDPIRVYERFATLDAVSAGRAEVTLGRGSFTESFPLFGLDLGDYERLFEEKLDLFAKLRSEGEISWQGTVRAPLQPTHVYPKTERGSLPTWIGVGGSPESVVRAARHGLPMMLAIIGGDPARFTPYVELYRRALSELDRPDLPVGVHSPGSSLPPTMPPVNCSTRTSWPTAIASGPSEAGPPPRAHSTTRRSTTARSMSGPLRPWPRRSPARCAPSGCSASTSSTATDRCLTSSSWRASGSTAPR
ncbi:LLM class flavin-dependent oxidoreductase [Nocardioides alcanivorans]|uniref:LLM class flavin-dependent oxidoreductase n=1 Tax=Nocardioides alcanivorans TaxID=2897352 RepID=UPI001F2FEAF0|nr:LLM class flavin-dependent oxidoreductase [Nocardioides alcanivorans]